MKNNPGVTLIEILLVIATMTVLAGLSIPIYQSLQLKNSLDVAAVEVVQTMRRAQVLAQASSGDVTWGVAIRDNKITLFQGGSYALRNDDFDEVFDLPSSITPLGLQEIVFDKFDGLPQITGTLELSTESKEIRNISINEKGTILY